MNVTLFNISVAVLVNDIHHAYCHRLNQYSILLKLLGTTSHAVDVIASQWKYCQDLKYPHIELTLSGIYSAHGDNKDVQYLYWLSLKLSHIVVKFIDKTSQLIDVNQVHHEYWELLNQFHIDVTHQYIISADANVILVHHWNCQSLKLLGIDVKLFDNTSVLLDSKLEQFLYCSLLKSVHILDTLFGIASKDIANIQLHHWYWLFLKYHQTVVKLFHNTSVAEFNNHVHHQYCSLL